MKDIVTELNALHRGVRTDSHGESETITVLVRRNYVGEREDVWDALASPDRLRRWFMPVSGDLRTGGSFQLEGNAGGDILLCDAPRLLRVTYGGPESVVELRLTADGDATALELEHTVPLAMAGSVAGALFVGPGWDGAFLALGRYLDGRVMDDPVAFQHSREIQEFNRDSIQAWTAVIQAAGTADAEQIEGARQAALAQYTPDLSSADD